LLIAVAASVTLRAQNPPQPKPVATEEQRAISNGWALLAAGSPEKAAAAANAALTRFPRSLPAASLLVEAEIGRGGSSAGLAAYERWLGSRKLEDGYLLRRVATALLWEASNSPEIGVEALRHLTEDDDIQARALLASRMAAGGVAETRALARIGDPGAVNRLIDMMKAQKAGSKRFFIEALADSKSPAAIPVLRSVLDDPKALYSEDVMQAAIGLGTLGATAAIPRLREIYNDQAQQWSVRFFSAAALYQMKDMSGIDLLQRSLTSDVPAVRRQAAETMSNARDATWEQVVRGLLGDLDPMTRLKAAQMIAPYDIETARQALEGLLQDPNQAVHALASEAMIERTVTGFGGLRRFLHAGQAATRVRAAGRVLELTR
jgi:HEAT repeat protein